MKAAITLILLLIKTNAFCQTVSFTDLELKEFLINELCVDSNNDGDPDTDADLNNDNEIQLSEATGLLNLHIAKLNNDYNIQSLQDLSAFTNLEFLKILYNNGISDISNLGLSNLKTFWFGSQTYIENIDISDLTEIIDLRIEDCDVNSINIKNGSVASNFSLFYTENIEYACVDNIAEEYNETLLHMANGIVPVTNCTLSVNENTTQIKLKVFPNPTTEFINFEAEETIQKVEIFDSIGQIIFKNTLSNNPINISHLKTGIYFLRLKINKDYFVRKIVKI